MNGSEKFVGKMTTSVEHSTSSKARAATATQKKEQVRSVSVTTSGDIELVGIADL